MELKVLKTIILNPKYFSSMFVVDWMKPEVVEELAQKKLLLQLIFFPANEGGKRVHLYDSSI